MAGEYAIDAYVGGLPVANSGVLLKVSPAPTDPTRTALSAVLGNGTLPSPLPVTAGTQAYVFLRSVDQVRTTPFFHDTRHFQDAALVAHLPPL